MTTQDGLSRRELLMKIGIFFNGIVAAVLAVPIVRYILSPVAHERKQGFESWLPLGELNQFPAGQTRFATYRNPIVNPLTERPQTLRAGCATWMARPFKSLRSTARIWVVQFDGFPNRICSCVPVMVVPITKTVLEPPDLRSADCSNFTTRLRMEGF